MKHFIPLLISLFLLSGCQHSTIQKKIQGKWINMSYRQVQKDENITNILQGPWPWINKTPDLSFDGDKLSSIYFVDFSNNFIMWTDKDEVARGEFYISREGKFLMLHPRAEKPKLMLEILSISEDKLEMKLVNPDKDKFILQKER